MEQKRVLAVVAVEYSQCPALQEQSFSTLEAILNVLRPFEQITRTLSSRQESISSVIPSYCALLRHLTPMETDVPTIKDFKSTIAIGLKSRMEQYLKEK